MGRFGDLFREADKQLQRRLVSEILETPFGRLWTGVQSGGPVALWRFVGRVEAKTGLFGRELLQIREAVERYARGDRRWERWIASALRSMGPAGRVLSAMLGGRKQAPAILGAAIELLRAFGYEVLPPLGAPDRREDWERAVEAAKRFVDWAEFLERVEGRVPAERAGRAAEVERELEERRQAHTPPAGQVEVPGLRGPITVPADHPLVTGEMVPVASSNVHSIGYDLSTYTLYVRFLWTTIKDNQVITRPGSLYGYRHVAPDEFLDFLNARSKGGWVWDHLRVRGTVSGHQKDYFLAGIVGGYVPRKATLAWITTKKGERRLAEVFQPRTVFVGGRPITSQRPLEVVQVLKVVKPPGPEMQHLVGLGPRIFPI